MGADPRWFLLALRCPRRTSLARGVRRGLFALADAHRIELAGGDDPVRAPSRSPRSVRCRWLCACHAAAGEDLAAGRPAKQRSVSRTFAAGSNCRRPPRRNACDWRF
jgi:hypothetical protein